MSNEYAVPATGALILNEENEIFLMKSPKWENKWIVPGGKVEKGDTLEETVRKEVREETGLELDEINLLDVKSEGNPDDFSRDTHFIFINYICELGGGEVELDDREGTEHIWIAPEEAVEGELELNDSSDELVRDFLEQR
jgi:nucleoside triphosphatase